jgi:competence protein ComEC
VASLILLAPSREARLNALAARGPDRQAQVPALLRGLTAALAVGVAATVGTLPLIAFAFHRVSLVGIPVTILALPALPPMLAGSAVAAFLGLVWSPLGVLAGWLVWVPLSYLLALVHLVSALPGITFGVGDVAPVAVGAFYGLLILLLGRRQLARWARLIPRSSKRATVLVRSFWVPRLPTRWALLGMLGMAAMLWGAALTLPDGRLHVTFLDVGQGDAVLIVTPSGRQVLVDGGPDPMGAVRALGDRLPFWDRSLDVVVLTPHTRTTLRG